MSEKFKWKYNYILLHKNKKTKKNIIFYNNTFNIKNIIFMFILGCIVFYHYLVLISYYHLLVFGSHNTMLIFVFLI